MESNPEQLSIPHDWRDEDDDRYRGGNLVLWIAVIAVLIGLNFASWSFCMWVFGQPEHPFNYRILTKLNRLAPIHGFTPVSAPRGTFQSPKDLYAWAFPFSASDLQAYNGILKRRYIRNFEDRADTPFLTGEFTVLSVRPMAKNDVFSSGYVILGRSTSFPDAIVDYALPSEAPANIHLAPGSTFRIDEANTCAVLLNVDRLGDGTMIFTVVPLVERTYEFGEAGSIQVTAPSRIHLDPEHWPISRYQAISDQSESSSALPQKPVSAEESAKEKPTTPAEKEEKK